MSDYLDKRLREVGLKEGDVRAEDLIVPKGQKYFLSQEEPQQPDVKWIKDACINVKPKSWMHLKQLIGISDKAAKRIPRVYLKPLPKLASPDVLRKDKELKRSLTASAIQLAKGYLYAESDQYAQYESIFTEIFSDFQVVIPILANITIEHDATLIVGGEVKTLYANDIKIKTGGRMNILSDMMHIHCRSIEGNIS